MGSKLRYFLPAFLISLPIDKLTKAWIIERLYYGERLEVIPGFFNLTHVRNPGGAFSLFAGGPAEIRLLFFVGMASLAIGLLVLFLVRLEPQARLAPLALGIILGGALGNLSDRIVHGEVIDFLDFRLIGGYIWPTFNFADSFIVVGVTLLIAEIFLVGERAMTADSDRSDPAGAGGPAV